jgi:hypothetical protein
MAGGQPLPDRMREEDVVGTSQADLALSRRFSTKAKLVVVNFGRQRSPRAVMCSWHHNIQFLHIWRIFELKAASRAVDDPSGVVPGVVVGGCGLNSPKSTGGEEGPFCFTAFLSSVLFANVEDSYEENLYDRILLLTFTAT